MIAPPPAGRALGRRWELRTVIGEAPGRVEYAALDRDAGVEVALWWLRPELFDDAGQRRLLASASAIRRGSHPNVRPLLAVASEQGHLLAAWGAAAGPSLQALPSTAVPIARLITWFEQVAAGLSALHGHGIVHGRLIPEDVVEIGGAACVGGAGLWLDADRAGIAQAWRDRERYHAPEVRAGAAPDRAADAYSLAAIAAELVSGVAMTTSDAMRVVARRHPPLHEILAVLLEPSPDARPVDLASVAAEVRAASAMPYLADDRSGPMRAIAPSRPTSSEPAARPSSSPPLDIDPAHPAFAPLTPVPGTLEAPSIPEPSRRPRGAGKRRADASESTRIGHHAEIDADVDAQDGEPEPPARPAPPPAVAGSFLAGAPVVLQAISMKPPDAPRPPRPEPVEHKPRVRRLSQAMARTFSTAPGSLGYLAPPKAATDRFRKQRLRRTALAATIAAVLLVIAAVLYLVVLR